MNIEEAIELLGGYVYEEKPCPVGLFDEAVRLGVKALTLLENPTDPRLIYARKLLLGEIK